ncbi:MAG TPA: cupin domain-containing protein [Terriglobia bacterium]|nr:cupin domain-containing protein [Terriglobia bacterium]
MGESRNARRLEKLVAAPANLAGLVEYQEDAVVSRIVIGKTAGTVTLFAFDEGQTLSEHTTPYDALVCALDGKAELAVSGKPHLLQAGDAIILPANEPHSVGALMKFKILLVMIRS